MDWNAPHLGYVIASYAASFIVLAALVLRVILHDRHMANDLRRREAKRDRRP